MALNPEETQALARIRFFNLPHAVNVVHIENAPRTILILGEAHLKKDWRRFIESNIIKSFDFRLTEGLAENLTQISPLDRIQLWLNSLTYWLGSRMELQPSSIFSAIMDGYAVLPNGTVLYDGCWLGRLPLQSNNVSEIVVSFEQVLSTPPTEEQLYEFEDFLQKILQARRRVGAAEMTPDFAEDDVQCAAGSMNTKGDVPVTIGLEVGPLEKWRARAGCGAIACTSAEWQGEASARDFRMAENIVEIFKAFPERQSALVIVGAYHVQPLKQLLEAYDRMSRRYGWELTSQVSDGL